MKDATAFVLALGAIASGALAGPDWIEQLDAGSDFATAQAVVGIGTPQRISGTLTAGRGLSDLEDIYLIRIDAPATFSFTMQNSDFDSQLYLFNITLASQLFGLLSNNNASPSTSEASIFQSLATDGSGAQVLTPGVYALAITSAGRAPVSLNGAIFNQLTPTELSGPDGPGGINPLLGWDGPGTSGSYEVELEGIGYVDVPAPGTAAALTLAGLLATRRRR